MIRHQITPGHTSIAVTALNLFGMDRVNPGSWASPVGVDLDPEEVEPFLQLAAEEMRRNVDPKNIERFKLLPLSATPSR